MIVNYKWVVIDNSLNKSSYGQQFNEQKNVKWI